MTGTEIALVILVGVALGLLWVWRRASRLDRLHRKLAATRMTLESELTRRATAAARLASSGVLDPVSSVLVGEAAFTALAVPRWDEPGIDRAQAESELSLTLRAALDDVDEVAELRSSELGARQLEELSTAWYRSQLARRFHNEAAAQTQRQRRKAVVRALHLAGHAAWPATVDLDDGWPEALGRPGASPG